MKKDRSFTTEDRKQAHLAVYGRRLGCLLSSLPLVVLLVVGMFAAEHPQGQSGVARLIVLFSLLIGGLVGLPLFFFSLSRVQAYRARFGKSVFDDEPTPARVAVNPAVEHESHTWSPWTMKSVRLYYSEHFRCYEVGQRTCLVCSETDICREHEWSDLDTMGSLQGDHTVCYRCRRCGATYEVSHTI